MTLNLKNPRTYELARQLSDLTGQTLTSAVTQALEERLRHLQQKRDQRTTADRILDFASRFAPGMPPDTRSSDHADLYGEDGLPR